MKSFTAAGIPFRGTTPASRRPLVRLLSLGPAALLLSGLLAVWAGPLAALVAAAGPASTSGSASGTVTAWGQDTYGQTNVPAGLLGVKAVGAGYSYSLALKSNGTVVAWGATGEGQTNVPAGLTGVIAIAAGDNHSLALKSNGTVVAWGWNYYGQATVPPGLTGVVAIAAGYSHSVALKANGTVVAWGDDFFHQTEVPAGFTGVIAIAASDNHSLALKSNGMVVAWGSDGEGEGDVPAAALSGVTTIAAGAYHSLALKSNGSVIAWGSSAYGQTTVPSAALSGIVALSAGAFDSLALKADGTVVAWGADLSGTHVTVPAGLSGVTAVAAGGGHSLALVSSAGRGPVAAWGFDGYHQADGPTSLSGVKAIGAGEYHSIALKTNGTVVAWGFDNVHETDVPAGLTGVAAISPGGDHNLVLKANGTVVGWGYDFLHQTDIPAGLSGVRAIAAGYDFSLALKSDGTVVGWGDDGDGQTNVPVGLSGVVAISAGYDDSLALKSNGTVVGWGENYNHTMDVPAGLSGVKAIAAGEEFDLALKSDGTVVAWGWDTYSQTDIPAGLSGVIAIAAGGDFSLALKSDGTVVAWGYNNHGQATVPAGLSGVTAIATGGAHSLALVAPATHLSVSGIGSPRTAGVAGSVSVRARDASGNTAIGYRGTVHFSSTDPAAVLPADYTFTAADKGVRSFNVTLYSAGTWSVTATDTTAASITGSQSGIVVILPASSYTAISPRRVLDTRPTGSGHTNIGLSNPFVAGTVRKFSIAGAEYVGGGSAPAVPVNAVAVTGNLTVVGETATGVIDLGPAVSAGGTKSSLNFVKGDVRANNVTLALAANGSLSAVYRSSTSGATTNLIFDVTGYFLPGTSGATYHTVTPGRVLDTRPTGGGVTHIGPLTKLPNRTVRTFPVAGVTPLGGSSALVPPSGVAVTGNLTVTGATSAGYVSLGPTMAASPSTSSVNVAAGSTVANGVSVGLSGGKLSVVWCGTAGSSANVIFDVTGYFTAGAGGLSFYAIAPVRVLDSSVSLGLSGTFASRTSRLFTIVGTGGVPSGAAGISGNLTLLTPSSSGWALVSPEIVATATTSTLNAAAGHSEANGFDVALGSGGHVALEWAGTTGSTANIALDITGYWK